MKVWPALRKPENDVVLTVKGEPWELERTYLSETEIVDKVMELPDELILMVVRQMFPETIRNKRDPLVGVDVIDRPRCEHAIYDNSLLHWRPISFTCACFACGDRRVSRARTFIRSPIHQRSRLWRIASKLYKQSVNFVYDPSTEYPYRTACVLDTFFELFGTVPSTAHGFGIKFLTINMEWQCAFAEQMTEEVKNYRYGDDIPSHTSQDGLCLDMLNSDTFELLRIFSVLRYYKAKLLVTFPNTSADRKPFIERLYSLRKTNQPIPIKDGAHERWWRREMLYDGFCDCSLKDIQRDKQLRSLILQALEDEKRMKQDHSNLWRRKFVAWGYESDEWEPELKIGHLTLELDFSV